MNLPAVLAQLETSQLVRRLDDPNPAYIFKHVLTQETAYQSLLKTQRRRLHRRVAEAIEQTCRDDLDALNDVLAYHWEEAEVPDRARHYLAQAGQSAARRYANQEAVEAFSRALALVEGATPEEVVLLHEARGHVYEFLSQYAQALADYEAALAVLSAAKDQQAGQPAVLSAAKECRLMAQIAWVHWLAGQGAQAVEVAREAEARAQALKDRTIALRAYLVAGLVAQAEGRLSEAYPHMRRALFLSRASEERALEGESLFYLGIQDNFMGRFGRAAICAQKAYEIKQHLGDRVGEVVSLYLKARAEAGRSHYDAALEALEVGRSVAEEIHNPFGLAQYPNTRAWLSAELGDWETAYEVDHAGLELARAAPVRPPEIGTLINLVLDCTALGKLDEAEQYMLELQQWIGRPEFGFHAWRWQTRIADARARLLLARSRYAEAAEGVAGLLGWAACTQARKYEARGLLLRAYIHLAQDELAAAEVDLLAAMDQADTMCYLPIRVEARRELTRLHQRAGAVEMAERFQSEEVELVVDLDRRLKHPELRRSLERGLARSVGGLVLA